MNWVLQLNNSQLEISLNSVLEKHHLLNSPNQPNPNPNQSVIDRDKVQEVGSLEHRDTTSSNANKFNLAIDDENIDFNISGVPHAMVKRSQSINVHNLIQQIENHPQREALQSDLRQHCAFNPFSKE